MRPAVALKHRDSRTLGKFYTGIIEVTVDGGAPKKMDTFTAWSGSLYLPWAVMLADELSAGHHAVRGRIASDRNPKSAGTALHVFQPMEN